MHTAIPVELSEKEFDRFGKILSGSDKEASCDDKDITYIQRIYASQMESLSTGLMTCKKREFILTKMEKHDNTPEIMVNLGGDAVLVLAEKDYNLKANNSSKIQAFWIKKGDAYVIYPGVWHFASYPIEKESVDYLIIFKDGTENIDMVNGELAEPLEIVIQKGE